MVVIYRHFKFFYWFVMPDRFDDLFKNLVVDLCNLHIFKYFSVLIIYSSVILNRFYGTTIYQSNAADCYLPDYSGYRMGWFLEDYCHVAIGSKQPCGLVYLYRHFQYIGNTANYLYLAASPQK